MKENFDCTQFITFNSSDKINLNKLMYKFRKIGFKVMFFDQIREVKKEYFKDYILDYFIELEYDEFLGNFEDWEKFSDPPKEILNFIRVLEEVINNLPPNKLRIILTNFAEEGKTNNELIRIKSCEIKEGLFYMSFYNYKVWTDNLILEIKDN